MKALVKERAGPSFVYKEVPLPTPHGDDLLVKVGKVALCGSDINLYEWNNGMFHMLCVLMAYGQLQGGGGGGGGEGGQGWRRGMGMRSRRRRKKRKREGRFRSYAGQPVKMGRSATK